MIHNNEAPWTGGTGFSTTTYILMGLGGLIGAASLIGGLGAAIRERVMKGLSPKAARQVPQLEMAEEASAPTEASDRRKGPLEIEIHGNAYAVERYEDRDVKRKINLVLPRFPEEGMQ